MREISPLKSRLGVSFSGRSVAGSLGSSARLACQDLRARQDADDECKVKLFNIYMSRILYIGRHKLNEPYVANNVVFVMMSDAFDDPLVLFTNAGAADGLVSHAASQKKKYEYALLERVEGQRDFIVGAEFLADNYRFRYAFSEACIPIHYRGRQLFIDSVSSEWTRNASISGRWIPDFADVQQWDDMADWAYDACPAVHDLVTFLDYPDWIDSLNELTLYCLALCYRRERNLVRKSVRVLLCAYFGLWMVRDEPEKLRDCLITYREWLNGGCDSCIIKKMVSIYHNDVVDKESMFKLTRGTPGASVIWMEQESARMLVKKHGELLPINSPAYSNIHFCLGDHTFVYSGSIGKDVKVNVVSSYERAPSNKKDHFIMTYSIFTISDTEAFWLSKTTEGLYHTLKITSRSPVWFGLEPDRTCIQERIGTCT